MKIAVCVKQVPNSEQISIDPVTHNLMRENTEMVVNPADLNALTEAIKIRELVGGTIDVFTMGIMDAKKALYTALAIGADRAFLITDKIFAGGDSLGTAAVLAEAIKQTDSYDLILCGALASDGATGQVGPMLAEILGLPSATMIKETKIVEAEKIHVVRNIRGKKLELCMTLPGVLTVGLGANVPVLPTLRSQMKAKAKEIEVITNEQLKLDSSKVGMAGAKSIVTETYLREKSDHTSSMLEGDAHSAAVQIADLLHKVLES